MLLYISFAGILISIISSYYNWKHNRVSIFLTALILIISIHGISHSALIEKANTTIIALLFNNLSPFFFLPGAFLFFYVRGTLNDNAFLKKTDIIHFIPFLIMVVNVFPYWLTPLQFKIDIVEVLMKEPQMVSKLNLNLFVPASISLISRSLILAIYVLVCAGLLYKHQKTKKRNSPQVQKDTLTKWLTTLLFFVFMIGISYSAVVVVLIKNKISIQNSANAFYSVYAYSCALAILGLQVTLLAFPQILYGVPILRKNETIIKSTTESVLYPIENSFVEETFENDLQEVDPEPFAELSIILMNHLQKNKSFLKPNFSIDDLARELDVPRHHLYYCLNRVMKTKFTDLRKSLRIEHAKKLLEQGVSETMSMEGIGFQSGFSSRSNFFNAFKSETGITPSEYLSNQH